MELIKKNIISIVLFLLATVGSYTFYLLQKGAEAEFNEKVEAIIHNKMSDSQLIKTLLDSDQVDEFTKQTGEELRNAIIEDVLKKDSNKIKQNVYLAKELGIRDEDLNPLLLEVLRAYKDGDLVKKEELQRPIPSF